MKKGLKRFIALVMVVIMTVMYVPVASAATRTGSLGNNVKWSYDSKTKVLTVTGSGDMKNFKNNNDGQGFRNIVVGTTQYPYTSATKVVVSEGITNIGNYALSNLQAVTSVQLPSTVKTIGNNAFDGCKALTAVNLTENITSIGTGAFKNTKFANVNMPYSVKSIGDNAFSGIAGLKITCNYGDAAYKYAVKHSASYVLRQPSVVYTTSFDENAKQVKLTLKLKDASGFNAGNFTLNYNDAVTPVSDSVKADDVNNDTEFASAIVYNEKGKISIALMSTDRIKYEKCAAECTYTVAEFVFKINGQADNAEFTVTPDIVLANDSRVTVAPVSASVSLHKYTDTVTKEATCKDEGEVSRLCSICGKGTSEKTAKNPNNHVGGTDVKNAVQATCSKEGYTGDTVCLGCGVTISKGSSIPVSDHHYETTVTPATCTADGFTSYKCKDCGNSYVGEKVPALGHDYGAGVVTNPTCTEAGYTEYTCSRCGDSYTGSRVPPLGHDYDAAGVCSRCGDVTVVTISFVAGSQLTADEDKAIVISKTTATVSALTAQVAAGNWTITDDKGAAVDSSAAVKTGYVIKNDSGKAYTLVILGDVNLDGKVNASDARSALRISAKVDTPTAIQSVAADVNRDSKTNASDARSILRVSAKVDPSF